MAANNLPTGYRLVEGYPSIEDYLNLRSSCLSPKPLEQSRVALKGSWYGAYVVDETTTPPEAVAMGRVIGDGGWYFLIADIMTLPEHQRKGLGDAVFKNLLAGIKSRAVKGTAYISLGADLPGRKLYQRNGFKETMPKVMGMSMLLECEGLKE
ncbi:hypothetical protein F4777DRAFT_556388 [Nemania sp. FL0916]|nr:hypothetical protein F4777DRAFT_556388 [Nemania sp. FL0916]